MENSKRLTTAKRIYRKLILLYPKAYRERFGQELAQTFSDMYAENPKTIWLKTGVDLLTSVPAQHAQEILNYMQPTQRFVNVPYAIAGGILIAPFCLILLMAMTSQFFTHQTLSLPGIIGFRMTWVFIILLPLLAVIINVIALIKEMIGKKFSEIVSKKFFIQNIFAITVAILAVLAIALIRLHDAVPCLAHHMLVGGFHNFGQTIGICRNA